MRIAPSVVGSGSAAAASGSGVLERRFAQARAGPAPRCAGRRRGCPPPRRRSRRSRSPGRCARSLEFARPSTGRRLRRAASPRRSSGRGSPRSKRLGFLAEERQQQELLLTRGQARRLFPDRVELDRGLVLVDALGHERDRPLHRRVDLARRRPEASVEKRAQLVDDGLIAARGQDVDDRLRGEDLPDRGCDRRRSRLAADNGQLLEDVVEAVGRSVGAQPRVDRGDEPRRQLVLRCPHGDVRGQRRDGVVADELVDDLGRLPERLDVDAAVDARRPSSALASASPETRCSVSAIG